MTSINVRFTSKELELLATLASDQLFRREFIDPKFPGYKSDSGEIRLGKELVTRLRSLLDRQSEGGMVFASRRDGEVTCARLRLQHRTKDPDAV